MRGRKPVPTALKLLRGNPGQRRLNRDEPQHPPLALACPADLTDPVARAEWDRLAPLVIPCGQVTAVDYGTLLSYCVKYAQWRALELEAAKHPFIVKGPNGPIANPAIGLANRVLLLMLKAASELGITPASRTRVVARLGPGATAPASKWAGIL